jgi:signal transduction histidine kinase
MARNIIISGCIVLLLFAFVLYRDAQLLEVEKLRNKLSKDLHDDIGSTLSSISINSAYVEKMALEMHPDVRSAIHDIGESARCAMENMSDIVWAINPKNETFKNMIERFEVFAQNILGAKNIRLHLSVIDPLLGKKLTLPQRKNLYLILKESINNIAKYSSAANCYVSTSSDKETIYLKIEDDGLGFDEQGRGQCGNGLANMKARARELDAEFSIASEKSKGTVITIEFLSWL